MTNSRATCRGGQRCVPDAGKIREALHCQFAHAEKTLEELAALEGISAHTLAAMVNPDREDTWLPSRRLSSLLDRTKDHDAFAQYAAAQAHCLCFRPPAISDTASGALVSAIAEQTRELSEAVAAIDKALRSGEGITVDELPGIDREIDDMVRASLRLKATVKRSALPSTRKPTRRTRS